MQSNEPQAALDVRQRELLRAKDLSKSGEFEQAYDIVYKWLDSDPNDSHALNLLGYIMLNTDKPAVAYPILKQVTQLEPENALGWLNMGMACSDLWKYTEAKRAYKKGIKYALSDEERSMLCVNMASCMVDHGDFEAAEPFCHEALKLNPDSKKARANLGFCELAQRKWVPGWENYRHCIDTISRPLIQYNNEPLWNGEKGHICVYTEQGLGDEISFAQMLPDMKRWCDENDSTMVVDVNPRLLNLFRRSFPDLEIHGTRGQRQITWDPRDIEYSIPIAQLGEYFRRKDSDFTGEPYLVPDPDRVQMWRSLFQSKQKTPEECPKCGKGLVRYIDDGNYRCASERGIKGCGYIWKTKNKPVIGLGWRGGTIKTAAKYRQLDLETLSPVINAIDAHWVSLQYKPSQKEIDASGADVTEYSYGTLSGDYDDTVAMIAAMDMVVTMQTTVVHVAGALGIPCWTFVPSTSQWRYGQGVEDFPWAKSVRIIRQNVRGQWDDVMQKTGEELVNYAGISETATDNARVEKDQLRDNSGRVRRRSGPNDRLNGSRPSA